MLFRSTAGVHTLSTRQSSPSAGRPAAATERPAPSPAGAGAAGSRCGALDGSQRAMISIGVPEACRRNRQAAQKILLAHNRIIDVIFCSAIKPENVPSTRFVSWLFCNVKGTKVWTECFVGLPFGNECVKPTSTRTGGALWTAVAPQDHPGPC